MHPLQASTPRRFSQLYSSSSSKSSRRRRVCHAADTQREVSSKQQTYEADVQRLEEAYRRSSVPSPEAITEFEQLWRSVLQPQLRAADIKQALPSLRVIRAAERQLEADVPSIGNAVIVMVAIIMYDMGWNNILDRWLGDSVLGSISCILVGLGLVFGIKISGLKPKDYWKL